MLLLFGQAGDPVDAYIVYNFRQVSDMVLLVTYQGAQRTPCKTILHQGDDGWAIVAGDDINCLSHEDLLSIKAALTNITKVEEPIHTLGRKLFAESA